MILLTNKLKISLSKILLQELGENILFLCRFLNLSNKNMNGYLEGAMNPSYQIAIVGAIKLENLPNQCSYWS